MSGFLPSGNFPRWVQEKKLEEVALAATSQAIHTIPGRRLDMPKDSGRLNQLREG